MDTEDPDKTRKGGDRVSQAMNDIKKLGFGLMRLPQKDGKIDIVQVKQMVDRFLAEGFTYLILHGRMRAARTRLGKPGGTLSTGPLFAGDQKCGVDRL